ncbi:hypothetical protein [Micromonospora inaquosa]|uniref:Uncharacterized protein n=1 Tax=Micromonospora inaquosa TaxID=2203716 RepID=A0A3N9X7J1_9ACTN|nr:hypothetical protein [Micromonospora inaquosa]RQX09074.1 hypothetical protein DLJ59_01200 [Micromonospora inaquosa]
MTGSPSGQLELLELEGRAAAELPRLLDLAVRAGIGPLWAAVLTGYSERTPSGGYHWLYRIADHETPGNTRLAQRAARPDELTAQERAILERHPTRRFTRCLAETRGEGGWVIVAPSHGPTHPTGLPYRRVAGSPRTIPTITWEQREQLHAAIRQLDEPVTPVRTQPQRTPPRAIVSCPTGVRGAVSPGDDFEARTDWSEVLEPLGWRLSHADGQTRYWTRPGKDRGVSATTGHAGDRDRLFVFSSSTELPSETPLTKFAAYAWLHHGGGFSAAARALRADGYGGSDTNNINDHRSARGSNR